MTEERKKNYGLNKVMLIGNLGKDPEQFGDEKKVTKFSLATTDYGVTNWHNCVAFGHTGNAIFKYLHKGSKIFLEGRVDYREYEKDGRKLWSTQIVVNNFQFLDAKEKENDGYESKQQETPF